MIFVNFKTYKEGTGENALSLARIISKVASETGVEIIACPGEADLKEVIAIVGKAWVQNVDFLERGKTTGWLPVEVAKEAGAEGTLLNHSEHKVERQVLQNTVTKCKEIGLKTLVFANSLEEAEFVATLAPDLIGYEAPELVGSRDTSVVMAKPDVIIDVIKAVTPVNVVVGAGIHNKDDVTKSLEFGAVGVALATDVVLAQNPEKELRELTEGFIKK